MPCLSWQSFPASWIISNTSIYSDAFVQRRRECVFFGTLALLWAKQKVQNTTVGHSNTCVVHMEGKTCFLLMVPTVAPKCVMLLVFFMRLFHRTIHSEACHIVVRKWWFTRARCQLGCLQEILSQILWHVLGRVSCTTRNRGNAAVHRYVNKNLDLERKSVGSPGYFLRQVLSWVRRESFDACSEKIVQSYATLFSRMLFVRAAQIWHAAHARIVY